MIEKIVETMARKGFLNWMQDEAYLKLRFWARTSEKLDLKRPRTFNEKLQWLKIHYRKPVMSIMVDKADAKEYIAERIGKEYIVPTLGVWDSFEEIDFASLPDQFVLKTTHDSGSVVICRDRSLFDAEQARQTLTRSLNNRFYGHGREWPYKDVKPRILAEAYLEDAETKELRDYKFFCFNGKAKCFKIDFDRFTHHNANYYDVEGNLLDFGEADYPPNPAKELHMPVHLKEMIRVAEILSEGFPFLRVDFFEANGKMYIGELTFYPASGFGKFTSKESEFLLGSWIRLPEQI